MSQRGTVADACPESRIAKTILHGSYSEFPDDLRALIEFAPDGFETPENGAIVAAYNAARSNGGNIAAYLEGDHALLLAIYNTTKEKVESPSEIVGDVRKLLNRAAQQKLTCALATIEQSPSQAFQTFQSLAKTDCKIASSFPAITDAAEFLAEPLTKPDELIAGILHQGSKLALGGGSKSFKTWTLLDLGLSVAHGLPWLGHETRPGRVLYINFEIQPWSWQSRLKAVADAKGITIEPGRFSVWNLRGKAADFSTLLPKIREAMKRDFVLSILDPAYKLYGGFTDENKAGDVAALMNGFEELSVSTGAAIAFGAHFSKGNQAGKESIDRISGSGVFARDPDSLLMFTKHEEDDAFTVEATLRNFPPMQPFVVRWKFPRMVPDESLDPSKLKQAGGRPKDFTAEQLMSVLGEQSLTSGQWKEQASEETGMKERTFYNLLRELQKLDRVFQSKINRKWTRVSK